jgi:hypothetical protein
MADEKNIGLFKSSMDPASRAVLNFPRVITPAPFTRNGKPVGDPKYECNLELEVDNPDWPALREAVLRVAHATWPGRDIGAEAKAGTFSLPWKPGAGLADAAKAKGKDREYSRGRTVLLARSGSAYPPSLAVIQNGREVDFAGDQRKAAEQFFYPGVKVWYQVNFSAWDIDGDQGVTAYLSKLISTNVGDRLAGNRSAATEFSGYAGVLSDENPTASKLADKVNF